MDAVEFDKQVANLVAHKTPDDLARDYLRLKEQLDAQRVDEEPPAHADDDAPLEKEVADPPGDDDDLVDDDDDPDTEQE